MFASVSHGLPSSAPAVHRHTRKRAPQLHNTAIFTRCSENF
uniref:Uncharacterized protein n=1 Tax=Anguilla anguilla TaxID=7936 RepID=A0A0E9TM03_ANGAN